MATTPRPPRLAQTLIAMFVTGEAREVVAGDLDQEFREALRAGVSVRAARRRYWRQSLASVAAIRRPLQERRVPLRGLRLDIRSVIRALRQNPGYAGVAVLSLAIGIGANSVLFSVVRQVLRDPLPVERPDELRLVFWTPNTSQPLGINNISAMGYRDSTGVSYRSNFSTMEFASLQAAAQGAADLAGYNRVRPVTVAVERRPPLSVEGLLVTGNFFRTLRPPVAIGRMLTEADDHPGAPPVTVLSYDLWTRFFDAKADALGKTVNVNGLIATVVGVTAPRYRGLSPGGFSPQADVTLAMALQPDVIPQWSGPGQSLFADPRVHWVRVLARVPEGTDERLTPALQPGLRAGMRAAGLSEAMADGAAVRLFPGARGLDSLRTSADQPLHLISIVAGVVLLIACINVAGLMLARGVSRQRELEVRRALGASRARIMRGLLVEGIVLSVVGGAAGVLLALWAAPALESILTSGLGTNGITVATDWRLLAVTAALACTAGLLSSLLPAIRFSRQSALQGRTAGAAPRLAVGRALLVLQIAVSLPLVTGAGLFLRTVHNLGAVDLGFEPDGLILFVVDPTMSGRAPERSALIYPRLLERLEALPGVTAATVLENPLIANVESDSPAVANGVKATTYLNSIGPHYIETMGARLLEGRTIDLRDAGGTPWSVLINETAVRVFFKGQSPLGHHLKIGSREAQVVGVIADNKYDGIRSDVPPTMLASFLQREMFAMHVAVRVSGGLAPMRKAIEDAVHEIDPAIPVTRYRTQREQIDETIGKERVFARLLTAFGAFALLLACVGLHGVTSYSVTRRTNEIGIRLALGARRSQVLWLVLRQVLALAAAGLVVGIPLALLAGPAAGSLLFGLQGRDPLTLLIAATIMVAVSVAAGLMPARRAARLEALSALRSE